MNQRLNFVLLFCLIDFFPIFPFFRCFQGEWAQKRKLRTNQLSCQLHKSFLFSLFLTSSMSLHISLFIRGNPLKNVIKHHQHKRGGRRDHRAVMSRQQFFFIFDDHFSVYVTKTSLRVNLFYQMFYFLSVFPALYVSKTLWGIETFTYSPFHGNLFFEDIFSTSEERITSLKQ